MNKEYETRLKIIYSKEMNEFIKEQLLFAESNARVKVHEWRNFIDYDITLILRHFLDKLETKWKLDLNKSTDKTDSEEKNGNNI